MLQISLTDARVSAPALPRASALLGASRPLGQRPPRLASICERCGWMAGVEDNTWEAGEEELGAEGRGGRRPSALGLLACGDRQSPTAVLRIPYSVLDVSYCVIPPFEV